MVTLAVHARWDKTGESREEFEGWHTSHFLRLARKPAWQPVLRRIIRSADWLLAASEEIRDVALGLYSHPRAEALTNGVDTEYFRATEPTLPRKNGTARVIVPRRLFEKNGVEYFIRAVPKLRERANVEAVIVRDGPLRSRLGQLARDLGVADAINVPRSQAEYRDAGHPVVG